jgi:hypothetical protein
MSPRYGAGLARSRRNLCRHVTATMVNENFPAAGKQELFAGLSRPELPEGQPTTSSDFA